MGNNGNRLFGKFKTAKECFALIAQVAWTVGIMYLGFFLCKVFHASVSEISFMTGAIAATAALLITLIGARYDRSKAHKEMLYSFRPSTVRANQLLYAVLAAFAVFGISVHSFMPYLILYYEQTLRMTNYVIVMALTIIIALAIAVFYRGFYEQLGFAKSILPPVGMLICGYVVLYVSVNVFPVFFGSLLMMSGYLCGLAVFGAKIGEHTPKDMAGRFLGIRMMGQVLVPGVLGPAIGAFVLRNAPQISNPDGTYSFAPDKVIWPAATTALLVLCVVLRLISLMVRRGHYDLWTEAGERVSARNNENDADNRESCAAWEEHDTGSVAWTSYPRPQLKRDGWVLLKENWTLNGTGIRMPFPPQALLSGYAGKVGRSFLYETSFTVPESFTKKRILIHFGAVDQTCEVFVNGERVGTHEGGYLAFTFDVTKFLRRRETNRLQVKVRDCLDKSYPYGKQRKQRGGMWYTPVSGIWQNVWLENVPETYIEQLVLTPDLEGVRIQLVLNSPDGRGAVQGGFRAMVTLENGETLEQSFDGTEGRIQLAGQLLSDGTAYTPKLWNTDEPYLYSMSIVTAEDMVKTYFALRTVEIKRMDGVNRVCLNGNPVFLHGVLDQGYFCDGIFLPAEEEEFERDILRMKELGFHLLRKHIKVEPECFYYYCDKHGMLVLQDMVNNGGYSFVRDTALPTIGVQKRKDTSGLTGKRKQRFLKHTKQTIAQLYNHPCIVGYTIFNEGWGQFESDKLYEYVKELDGTRLVDSTSGWFAQEKSDFDSRHIYFKAEEPEVGELPLLVSECGGYSRVVEGHYYSKYNTYGYGSAENAKELTERITGMYHSMIVPGIKKGICGCIYTQLSDVEDELNGLYTYDRKVCKVEKEAMQKLAKEMENELK